MAEHSNDRFFNADGARLRYRDEGSGPAVLLLHGWTLDLEMWDSLTAALRTTFRVVRLDRRGFGLSTGLPSPRQDVADAAALCRLLSLESVALIGMSQGARAALGLASAAHTQVSCLLLDGPPDIAGGDGIPLRHFAALARRGGVEAFRREWAAHPLMQLRSSNRQARELLNSMLNRYPGSDLLQDPQMRGDAGEPIAVERIAVPVLVITGEHDLASRVLAADHLARRLPGAQRAVIPGAAHLASLDNPAAYAQLVRAFLIQHAPASIPS